MHLQYKVVLEHFGRRYRSVARVVVRRGAFPCVFERCFSRRRLRQIDLCGERKRLIAYGTRSVGRCVSDLVAYSSARVDRACSGMRCGTLVVHVLGPLFEHGRVLCFGDRHLWVCDLV